MKQEDDTALKVAYIHKKVNDLIAQNKTSVLKSDIQNYYGAANMVMAPTPAVTVRIEVFGFRMVADDRIGRLLWV